MKTLIFGTALLAVLAVPAVAESRYDQKLEQAVMEIVARKIGEIRGALPVDAEPVLVTAQDPMPTGSLKLQTVSSVSAGGRWIDGLAPAVERRVSRVVYF